MIPPGAIGAATLVAIQRLAGNRAATALAGGPVVVQRAPGLTPAQKQKIDSAEQLVAKASKSKESAAEALKKYAAAAPGSLAALKANFDAGLKLYAQAQQKVNYKIETTKEIAAVRNEVLLTIVDAATSGIVGKIDEQALKMVTKDEEMRAAFTPLSAHFTEISGAFTKPFAKPVASATAAATSAVGLGGVSGGEAGTPEWASELSFYRSYAELAEKGGRLLPLANAIGEVSGPTGKLEQAIKDARIADRVLSYPVEQMDKDATVLENGTRAIAAAAPGVATLAAELTALVTLAQASAPRTVDEVEDELWVNWVAGLSDPDILDETYLEDYLSKRGIFARLGIEIGGWFSSEEENLAMVSATAQAKVTAHRGFELTLHVYDGRALGDAELPGLPAALPVVMSPGGPERGEDAVVKAVVVGAKANRTLDTSILKQAAYNKKALSEYVLRNRYISVVARGYEVVSYAKAINLD